MSRHRDLHKMQRAVRGDAPVAKPALPSLECWGLVRTHTGKLMGAEHLPCRKNARPGHLTCWAHRDREDAAQALKAHSDERKVAS